MSTLAVNQCDGYMEIQLPEFISLDKRMEQLEFLCNFVLESRQTKVLVVVDQINPATKILDIHSLSSSLHREDWKIRNKGVFLKIAMLTPAGKLSQYDFHQRTLKAGDLNISFFDQQEAALSWLLGH